MGTSAFQQNVTVNIEGREHLLVRKVDDHLWQLEDVKTLRISERTSAELLEMYASESLLFVNRKKERQAPEQRGNYREISDAEWEGAKLRRLYVMAILGLPSTARVIEPIIMEVWKKTKRISKQELQPPNAITVMRWKRKYLEAGKDISALVDSTAKKGNRTSRFPEPVNKIVSTAIDLVYLKRERGTIQDTLDKAIVLTISENQLLPEEMRLPMPTRRMVRSAINAIPAFDRHAARYGRTAAIKKFRAVLGHRVTTGPLERAEIDHTPLDMFVVDESTGLPLGRPWLTVCIDDFTRCILGIHIGFEPPSYLSVAKCLRHSFVPKASLKAMYPNIKNSWDAYGVMRSLVVDNGVEFHSKSLEVACFSLGIEIHYSARKTPWFKGKVERFQGALNAAVTHGQPGTTFSNIFEKDDYVPANHAVVTLSKLREIVHLWIVDYYHQRPHRTLMHPPAVLWKSSVNADDILLPDDLERLDAILGRSEERRLTHKGIELDGLFYNSPELTGLRMRHGAVLDVEVKVDDSNVGQIIVLSPDRNQIFRVPALAAEYAKGLSGWQHRVCKRFALRELKRYDPASWLEAKEKIAEIIEQEFMHKKQRSRTKVARYKADSDYQSSAATEASENEVHQIIPLLSAAPLKERQLRPSEILMKNAGPPALREDIVKRFKPIFRDRGRSSDSSGSAGPISDEHGA